MKKYYPEIDGLRAIAIFFVLVFHLNPTGIITGGYLGVDIFFVISGYLITGIIYNDIVDGKFKFFQFLNRRIARLYPALLFMIFIVIVAGFFIYTTDYYVTAAKTIKFALFSISNIKFMHSKGYWDISSIENPLLHTWSLGVEQQFYLFFPLVLCFFYKIFKFKITITATIIILSIISLVSAQYLSDKIPTTNFYFASSRLFELGIGGLLAIIGNKFKKIANINKEILLVLGLVLIFFCAIFYPDNIKHHPGLSTLPVILGTILCILYGDTQYTGKFLRQKIIVYIGTISYSIYLIHWPLIVFYKYTIQEQFLTYFEQIMLFLTTIIIASIMYNFIENKYRRISISIFHRNGKIFVCAFLFLIISNYSVIYTKGFPQRLIPYPEETVKESTYAGFISEYSKWNNEVQILGDQNQSPIAIFVGDSFLGQFVEQIDIYFKNKNKSVLILGEYNCLLFDNINKTKSTSCINTTKKLYIELLKSLPVIRISNWSSYKEYSINNQFYDNQRNLKKVEFEKIWDEFLRQQEINKNKMLLVLSHPKIDYSVHIGGNPPLFYLINKNNEFKKIKYKSDYDRIETHNQLIELINNNENLSYIETYDIFCDKEFCYNAPTDPPEKYFYAFNDHLSRSGAKQVWDQIGDDVYQFILDNFKDDKVSELCSKK